MKPYYEEDGITIYHGDCREILPQIQADVLISDPPYGMAYKSGWSDSDVRGDSDTVSRDVALAAWKGPALVFGRWSCSRPASTKHVLIWNKGDWPGMGDLSMPWGPSWEEIYVIGAGFIGKRTGSILHYPQRPTGAEGYHPTEKPVSLMSALIKATPEEWVILNPFMGSGSTLEAAKKLGRKATGIECEEKYCKIATARLRQSCFQFSDLMGTAMRDADEYVEQQLLAEAND